MFLKIKFKESQVFYTFNNKYSVIRTRSKLTFISNMNTTSKNYIVDREGSLQDGENEFLTCLTSKF
ncbi:hypothetical protein HUJ05_003241 [Dendroctonus ponderosae]|nr:hypothetical protein HUJ05_003241 [Dendroctonus ponderosae]